MDFIIWVLLIFFALIGKVINIIMQKRKEKNISFDEFDNIEKIKKQELKDKQEMQYETEVLNKVYNDSYNASLANSATKYTSFSEINSYDRLNAHLEAQKAAEKAKKDLYNFKFLDSVEIEEETIVEGSKINNLKENGNNFDIQLFKKWSRQIFGCIKLGSEKQLQVVKNFMSEELYDRLEYQMKQFAKDGLEFVTEDLLIEKCNLYDYSKSLSKEEIKILISASMKEYIIQKSTNKILRGNNKKSYNKKIVMTFLKQNVETTEGLIHTCPNCGAETTQTEIGKCRYCNTLVVPIRYNWTLTKFETL